MVNISLFSQLLSFFPREKFDRLVKRHGSDKHSKGINSWTHFVSMLFCHIGGAGSVRDISQGLRSTTGNINHLGIGRVPCKSSLSYINKHRSYELFRDFYYKMLEELWHRHTFARNGLKKLKRNIYLLDATLIPLCLEIFDWATYRSSKGAVKMHTVLDYHGCLPVFTAITEGSVHEINIARKLSFPTGSVIVMDRGYVDYKWLHVLDGSRCFFVTRAKTNMAYQIIEDNTDKSGDNAFILADQLIRLTTPQAGKDYPEKLRMVVYLDSKSGQEYTFITNNLHWKAQTVADIYKERWHIEVFFKHIKQNLKIKSFVGTSENAVKIQLWTALIAVLLLKFLKEKARYKWHLSNLVSFIRLNLFVKIGLKKWLDNPFYEQKQIIQMAQLKLFDG
ncbi:IS4 family transposase [Olivibacter sp. XZL3]|uniref:IS4 family transposase n=1 Tax=Olivibacter sp. XZL3 TaxID=1735116 RepID=UPI001065F3E2|nr:IS4 family transposase [Olivibacter sp. XZL3]